MLYQEVSLTRNIEKRAERTIRIRIMNRMMLQEESRLQVNKEELRQRIRREIRIFTVITKTENHRNGEP